MRAFIKLKESFLGVLIVLSEVAVMFSIILSVIISRWRREGVDNDEWHDVICGFQQVHICRGLCHLNTSTIFPTQFPIFVLNDSLTMSGPILIIIIVFGSNMMLGVIMIIQQKYAVRYLHAQLGTQ